MIRSFRTDGIVLLAIAWTLASWAATVAAQDKPNIAGDYDSQIGSQSVTLHLRVDPQGALSCTLDHLELAAPWMFYCSNVRFDGRVLSFNVASANATWKGALSKSGAALEGTWTQKQGSWFVDFTRSKFTPAAKPSPVDGIWLGMQKFSAASSSRYQIVFKSDSEGREYCTMDGLEIYTMGMECANIALKGDELSFDVPSTGAHWSGKLSPDGNALTGTLTAIYLKDGTQQLLSYALNLTRQAALTPEKPIPPATYDAAMPPVPAADLEAVLVRDLAVALKGGELAPQFGEGVSIAVYRHGVSRTFCIGDAKPDSIFEIGSLTKTFTGLLLAQMAAEGKVKLDEPVRELLPPGTVAKPAGGEITLVDLATRRSGLPPMPDNIRIDKIDQPYADYHPADLLAWLSKHGVANPNRAPSNFGSLGFSLLGVALANRAGVGYGALFQQQIAGPLGLTDTALALTPEQQARLLPGHDQFRQVSQVWQSDALSGAIGLRSTAGDLLKFLVANLHAESCKPAPGFAGSSTLAAALALARQPQAEVGTGMRIALGWLYQEETGNYWHNGATAAHSAYAFFNPAGDYAAVVLLDASPGLEGSFAEQLGRHISQRLAGKPAISIGIRE